MKRAAFLFTLAAVAVFPTIAAAQSLTGPQTVAGAKPAIEMKTSNLGKVIATPGKYGLYYWNVEKRAGGRSSAPASAQSPGLPCTSRGRSRSTSRA